LKEQICRSSLPTRAIRFSGLNYDIEGTKAG
jgi:hypothetical protein